MFSNRDLRKLLIPLIFEQLLSGLMGIADTVMVTRVGDTAIAAVSCVNTLNTLMIYLFSALAAGGTIVCSQYLGREDRPNAIRAGQQVYLVAITLSLFFCAIAVIFRQGLLALIFGQVEPAIMEQAKNYLLITGFTYPCIALQQTSAAQFRVGGNSRLPMLVSTLSNLLNIVGNALLIYGLGLGVVGAAIATLLSRIVNALVLLICQRDPKLILPLRNYRSIRPQRGLILTICRVAIPAGVENSMFQLGKLLVQSTVTTLGTTAIAAQAMIGTQDLLQDLPGSAFGIALLTVAGQCLGAGRVEEAKQNTTKLCISGWFVIVLSSLTVLLLSRPICAFSGLSPSATQLTFKMMVWITLGRCLFIAPGFCLPSALRAAGDVTFPAAISCISMWTLRVGLSWLLCRHLGFGLEGVWIAWISDWLLRAVCYIWRWQSGIWKTKHVLDA